MSAANVQNFEQISHQYVGLPAFFRTLEKVAGIVPADDREAMILWETGRRLFEAHEQQKQAAARVPSGLLAKAAARVGVRVDDAETAPDAEIARHCTAALEDPQTKQALAAYKQALLG